jgi:hypothetical protein
MHATYQQAVKSANAMKKALGPMWRSRVYKSSVGDRKWNAQARVDKPNVTAYVQPADGGGYVSHIV